MIIGTFKLDGIKGTVDDHGWIRWASINCHVNALDSSSLLSQKAFAVIELNNPFDISSDFATDVFNRS